MQEIIVAISLLSIPLFFLWRYRRTKRRDFDNLEDAPGPDEIVLVEHNGFPLTMTEMERLEYWENMNQKERKHHVHKVKTAIKKGKLVAVIWEQGEHSGRTVYVHPTSAKRLGLEEVRVTKRKYGSI